MNKENVNKNLHNVIEEVKEYLDLKTELYSLIVFERVSKLLSKFLVAIIVVFFLLFVLLFASLGFVEWFYEATGIRIWGYFIVSFFYLILGFIVYKRGNNWFLNSMLKGFTDVMFEEEDTLETKTKSKKKDEKYK